MFGRTNSQLTSNENMIDGPSPGDYTAIDVDMGYEPLCVQTRMQPVEMLNYWLLSGQHTH